MSETSEIKINFIFGTTPKPKDLGIGDYNYSYFGDAVISGESIIGTLQIPEGMAIYLYPKDNFEGYVWILGQSNGDYVVSFNQPFSVRVINTNAIRIYENINYEGGYKEELEGEPKIADIIVEFERKSIGSMLIPAGMIVTYYQEGVFKFLWQDTPDLGDSFIPDEGIIYVKKLSDAIDELNANNQEEVQIDNWEKIKTIFSLTSS